MVLSYDGGWKYTGSEITLAHFGANFLFTRDSVDPADIGTGGGAYINAVDELGLKLLRYPGGAISEDFFDIENPNATIQNGVPVAPLNGFLEFCGSRKISAIVVIPTRQFLSNREDKDGNQFEAVDEAVVERFVIRTLKAAQAKGAAIDAFEIGNEWYYTGMTPTEYGRVASRMALVVQEAIKEFRSSNAVGASWDEPNIVVQTGHRGNAYFETKLIFDQFSRDELRAVDGLNTHRFLSDPAHFGQKDGLGSGFYGQFDSWATFSRGVGFDKTFTEYVTEWNVKGENLYETGLRSASSMVWLFSELVEAGVSKASFYAVLQNNKQNLANSSGLPGSDWDGLSISGEMFRMLSEATVGLQLVKSLSVKKYLRTEGEREMFVETFGSATRDVIYASNRTAHMVDETFDIRNLSEGAHYAYVRILGVAEGCDPLDANEEAVVLMPIKNWLAGGKINVDLKPWETAEITILKGQEGLRLKGSQDSERMDLSDRADRLYCLEGNDFASGNGGADTVRGGLGNDTCNGGSGADVLSAEHGNDLLLGGAGNDVLAGGAGADTLVGGGRNDLLTGGAGSDVFVFGDRKTVRDGCPVDQITDFQLGVDVIDLRPLDADASAAGNQAFTFVGATKFSGAAGELRVAKGVLQGDVDGDMVADFKIIIDGEVLNAGDLLL